jgi:hypothetical protein
MAAITIRAQIEAVDKYNKSKSNADQESYTSTKQFGHVYLGSCQRPTTVAIFAAQSASDTAFHNFRAKLRTCVRDLMKRQDAARQPSDDLIYTTSPVVVEDSDLVKISSDRHIIRPDIYSPQIIESRYLKIDYESMDTWRLVTGRLHCNPSMNGQEQYDCVMVKMSHSTTIFCKLVRVFMYSSHGETLALALVRPMSAPCTVRRGDRELGLCRVRAKPSHDSLVIPVQSFVRGALLAADNTHPGEFTVVDTIDTDMFLRLIPLFPCRDMVQII